MACLACLACLVCLACLAVWLSGRCLAGLDTLDSTRASSLSGTLDTGTWGELYTEKDCEPAWLQIGRDGH